MDDQRNSNLPETAGSLRARAEKLLQARPEETPTLPTADVQALLHELNVHQMELEIQNEELRQAQLELAHARDRYADLYEFAPIGYVALSKAGKILEANLTAATMLGVSRGDLLGASLAKFVVPDKQDALYLYLQDIFSTGERKVAELGMRDIDGNFLMIRLESIAFGPEEDRQCRTALLNVTKRWKAETVFRRLNIDLGESLEVRTSELQHSVEEVRLLTEALSNLGEGVVITLDELEWPGPEIIFVNEAMCRITGYKREELLGKTPRVLQGGSSDRKALRRIREELSAGRSCVAEVTNYRKDGSTYDAELFITPLWNEQGKRTNFVSIHRDITERKKIERALRESEERFRMIFENAPMGIAIVNPDGSFERFNATYRTMFDLQVEDLRSMVIASTVHPDDRAAFLKECGRLWSGEKEKFEIGCRCLRKDGALVWVGGVVSTLAGPEGGSPPLIVLVADVTARRCAEEEARARSERLRAIMNATVDAIITIDDLGVIIETNPAAESIFGFEEKELIGQNVSILMPSPDRENHDGYLERYHRTGKAGIMGIGREVTALRKDGTVFDADLSIARVEGLGLFVGVLRDITVRKTLEQEVLNIAEEERQRIAYDLHDDLGSLLTGIKLGMEAMCNTLIRDESGTVSQCEGLAEQISNAILKVRVIAQGLRPVAANPEDLASSLDALARQVSSTSGVEVHLECGQGVRVANPVFANHLYRIAQEALNNALKHSNASSIQISLQEREGRLELAVIDNGSGIEKSEERGSGIGLHTMQYRANAMHGSLWIGSEADGGTKVVCSMPLGPPDS